MATRRRGLLIAVAEVEVSAKNSSKDGCKLQGGRHTHALGQVQILVQAGFQKRNVDMHNLELLGYIGNRDHYTGLNADAMYVNRPLGIP